MSYPSLNFALGDTIDMLREQTQAFVAAELAPRAAADPFGLIERVMARSDRSPQRSRPCDNRSTRS